MRHFISFVRVIRFHMDRKKTLMMITDKQGHKRLKRPSPFLGACVAVAVLALLLVIYNFSKPVPMVGSKTITIDVVYKDGSEDSYHVTTEAQYLKEAVDDIPELTIEGTTTEEYGLMMITVNGVRADYTQDGAYWALLLDRSSSAITTRSFPICGPTGSILSICEDTSKKSGTWAEFPCW